VIQFASIILFHAALESHRNPRVKKKVKLLMYQLIYHARMTAAVEGIGKVVEYADGNEIGAEHVALIPRELIGTMLSPEQVRELAARLGRSDDPDWK